MYYVLCLHSGIGGIPDSTLLGMKNHKVATFPVLLFIRSKLWFWLCSWLYEVEEVFSENVAMQPMISYAVNSFQDLGIHTELVCDGILDLIDAGVINNRRKSVLPGKVGGRWTS